MNVIEHHWSKEDARALSAQFARCGENFVSCDPDSDGSLVVWRNGAPVMVVPIPYFEEHFEQLARTVCHGVRVLSVVETQHLQRNPLSSITMARRAGYVIGILSMMARSGAEVISVHPSTWQYWTAKQIGVMGKLEKGQTKEVARRAYGEWCERNVPGWHGFRTAIKQGCVDAVGIGRWWRSVT